MVSFLLLDLGIGSAVDKFRRGSVVSNNPDGNLLSPASNESSLRVNPQSSPRAAGIFYYFIFRLY